MADGIEVAAAIVVPTYNHADRVAAVLDDLRPLALPIIVVDDGSTDTTPQALDDWGAANPGIRLVRIRHERNKGKACALRTGFAEARRLGGVTHAVTIDSDGQLDAADIPGLLAIASAKPSVLVIGSRPTVMPDCPARCQIGRRCASLGVLAQTGRRLSDTQCGLRVYPLEIVESARCAVRLGVVGGRYAFEGEIVTRALWAGFDVVESPVRCRYFAKHERVSHFRPISDSLRQVWVHARLTLRALAPWVHTDSSRAGTVERTAGGVPGVLAWLNPARCWRTTVSRELGRLEFAASLALGVWIGTLPFFGFHTAMCLYVAWRLHLHPAPMVLGSQVSIPPLGVGLAVVSIWVGSVLLTGKLVTTPDLSGGWRAIPRLAWEWLPAWTVGSVLVGLALALVVFGVALAWDGSMRRSRSAGPKHEETAPEGARQDAPA